MGTNIVSALKINKEKADNLLNKVLEHVDNKDIDGTVKKIFTREELKNNKETIYKAFVLGRAIEKSIKTKETEKTLELAKKKLGIDEVPVDLMLNLIKDEDLMSTINKMFKNMKKEE